MSDSLLCPALRNPMDCSMPGFPVHPNSQSLLRLMSFESVMPSNHLILCHPLLLLPLIFPSIRLFSNESVLCIRWLKYWNFSFIISLSNEYLGLISSRMDWLGNSGLSNHCMTSHGSREKRRLKGWFKTQDSLQTC